MMSSMNSWGVFCLPTLDTLPLDQESSRGRRVDVVPVDLWKDHLLMWYNVSYTHDFHKRKCPPFLAEHCRPVQCHTDHPARHDASHPLREGGPWVAARHRLLRHSGVLQLRLRPRDHQVHWDEQDQGYCHQRSYLYGTFMSFYCSVYGFVKYVDWWLMLLFLASNHLLPLCAVEGPLRAWCSVKCGAIVSGENECKVYSYLIKQLPRGV